MELIYSAGNVKISEYVMMGVLGHKSYPTLRKLVEERCIGVNKPRFSLCDFQYLILWSGLINVVSEAEILTGFSTPWPPANNLQLKNL
jgi:hypothetical protein